MSAEKRTAAAFPQLKKEGKLNTEFFDELDLYYKDHFAYRQEMITLDEMLSTKIFETSQNKDVIYGTEGWLFYGETMDEFLGRNVLSDRQIHNAARSLKLMQDYAKSYDANFVVAVAPIKAELYARFMPGNYLPTSRENNFDKLKAAMDKEGVNYVDLHKAFAEPPGITPNIILFINMSLSFLLNIEFIISCIIPSPLHTIIPSYSFIFKF